MNVQKGYLGCDMASLIEVAKAAGVSRQTVSNVVNAPDRVRPETRERVEAVIEELGYQPNASARNLRRQRSHLIGVDLAPSGPDEVSPVLERFVHALSEAAARVGFHVLIFPRTHDPLTSHVPLHQTRTVDGFVLVDTHHHDPRVATLAEHRIPFVTFGRTACDIDHDAVDVDGAAGAGAVAGELARAGCVRPAYVAWPESSLVGETRLRGFLDGWEAAGHNPGDVAVLRRHNRVEDGVDAVGALAALPGPFPDAIATVSDLLAVGVLRGLRTHGLTVGEDVRLIGFDDAPIAAHLDPPLTTVRQPLVEVANRVVTRFLARLDDPDSPCVTELLSPELVVRQT